ncbi:MAG: hypothetical protein ACRER2_10165 [Methylococcales bacterium]
MGALKLNPSDPKFLSPKEHTSLAGLKVRCHKSDGQDIELDADEFLMGFDREGFDNRTPLTVTGLDSLRAKPFLETLRARYKQRDDAWITNQVAASINQAIREPWILPGDRDDMKFSPMRLFLENIWKETIRVTQLRPTGGDRLRKSP